MDKFLKIVLVIFGIFLIVSILGGLGYTITKNADSTQPTTMTADDYVQSVQPQNQPEDTTPAPVPTPQQPVATEPTPTPKSDVFQIEERVGNENVQITVNGVRIAKSIDEKNNEYEVATAPSGEEYIIADVTIENTGNYVLYFSPSVNFNVYDTDGYSYPSDFTAQYALKRSFDGADIAPGSTRRGEVPFLVPIDKTGLRLQFTGGSMYAIIALN